MSLFCPHCGGEVEVPVRALAAKGLTAKEMKVAKRLIETGGRNRAIAASFGTSEQVIKNVLRSVYAKTGVRSRVEFALAWRNDLFRAGLECQ